MVICECFRYFFKTECEDLDMKVIQEEITDDNEVLPLWEGKIMAQVKLYSVNFKKYIKIYYIFLDI